MPNTIPTRGRIVLYVLPESSPRKGEERAAIVTSDFGNLDVNLNVQLDQVNDIREETSFHPTLRVWSAKYDESGAPGTWHWMPYQIGQAAKTQELAEKLGTIPTFGAPQVATSGFLQVVRPPPAVTYAGSTSNDTVQISNTADQGLPPTNSTGSTITELTPGELPPETPPAA